MKKYFMLSLFFVLIQAQDAAGSYKLSGVDVLYTYVTRDSVPLTVTDAYGLGITQTVLTIPAAVPFTSQAMQITAAFLPAVGINLNITLNEDGSGSVSDGSFYPDVNTIVDENGACITLQQVLPVSDDFTYESSGSMMADVGMMHPGVNVLGLPGISTRAGTQMGGFGLAGSFTFEDFGMTPIHPTMCDATGECFPFTVGDLDSSGSLEISPDVNALGIPEYVPGGVPLTGLSGGYFLKSGLNADTLSSVFPGNTQPNFILEWHGVDGVDSGLGYADDEDEDEDGDGTWFDRTLGVPGITATYMSPSAECGGYNYPIYGDLTETFTAMGMESCIDRVESAAAGYLMDPSGSLSGWGNFLTGNGAQLGGCVLQASTGGMDATAAQTYCATEYPDWLVDDSDHDFDGTDGRLTMNFDIPCVPVVEAREVVAEFIEVGGANGECVDQSACNYGEVAPEGSEWPCYYGSNDAEMTTLCFSDIGCMYDCDGNLSSKESLIASEISLNTIYPNPFNPTINISYTLSQFENIQIAVYDILGKEVVTLFDGFQNIGSHSIMWDASDYPSGLYFIYLKAPGFNEVHKVMLMK